MEELVVYIREAVDRKQENMRRRRRRDALRLQLVKVLKLIAENETFGVSPCVLERDTMSLHPTFVDYMDGARLYLEAEVDKDNISMREVKVHFCDFIRIMIKNFSREFAFTLYYILKTSLPVDFKRTNDVFALLVFKCEVVDTFLLLQFQLTSVIRFCHEI